MIWIIALGLLAFVGGIGQRQGGVRAAFSILGLLVGAILAMPLSPLVRSLLSAAGVQMPWTRWAWAPVIVFFVFLIVFKIMGYVVHDKIDYIFKYKKEDEERIRWERLAAKLGLCLGLLEGAIWFFLLMIPIYVAGYFTVQMAAEEGDPAWIRYVSSLRHELQNSKLDLALAACDPAPRFYYESADILGLLRQNPILERRLSHYPGFFTLSERTEIQELAADKTAHDLINHKASISELLDQPKVRAVVMNQEILTALTSLSSADLKDLREYLETGKSPKFDDEKILGRWSINVDGSIAALRKKMPTLTPIDANRIRAAMKVTMGTAILTATPENKILIRTAATSGPTALSLKGTWQKQGDHYEINISEKGGDQKGDGTVDSADRLTILLPRQALVFDKET